MSATSSPESRPLRPGIMILVVVSILSTCFVLDHITDDGVELVEEANGARPILIRIEMDSKGIMNEGGTISVQSGPGQTGSSFATGNVSLYRDARVARNPVYVQLFFRSDSGLVMGSVTPSVITFRPQAKLGSVQIRVNILINPMTNYSTGINQLVKGEVYGKWNAEPNIGVPLENWYSGDVEPYPVYVNIKPFHYLLVTFDPPVLQIFPGMSGDIYAVVRNTGNGNERVDLWVVQEGMWAQEGWVFNFEKTTVDIGPNSEQRVKIHVTTPRKLSAPYHMELKAFTLHAESYYSKIKYEKGEMDRIESYEMDFMVYLYGVDVVYLPWLWAVVLYLAMAVVLFNLGINVFTMRKRRLPRGKEPGFLALKNLLLSPERKRRWKEERRSRSEARKREREERRRQKELLKAEIATKGKEKGSKAAPFLPGGKKKKVDLGDLELDLSGSDEPEKVRAMAPADLKGEVGKAGKAPALPFGRKKKERMEDLRESLSLLDDD